MDNITLSISIISLVLSGFTLWLTYFRRGRLRMTTPNIVFFGFDDVPRTTAKVFVRTLLYSTALRGQAVESMFARLHHDGNTQEFTFWGYGPARELSPGSGLYVEKSGIAANHHFVLSVHEPDYEFVVGTYDLEIFARTVGRRKPVMLNRVNLDLSADLATALARREGVLFERRPNGRYEGHADARPKNLPPPDAINAMLETGPTKAP